ncbi:MAG: hypothetical protein QNJ98_08395 [Planctomycetota bacterium]|nr:hypothetical protein [Planctomycetota bacterium]
MHRTAVLTVLLGLSALVLPACGGGGGGPEEISLDAPFEPGLTGMTLNRNNGETIRGNPGIKPPVGDLETAGFTQTYRAIYSFALPEIPEGAELVSAEMILFQRAVVGDPMGLMQMIIVDHIDMGATYDGTAFDDRTLGTVSDANGQPVPLSTDASLGERTIDVTAEVQADIDAGRGRSQYRLRGLIDAPNGNGESDLINFSDGRDPVDRTPRIVLTFRVLEND